MSRRIIVGGVMLLVGVLAVPPAMAQGPIAVGDGQALQQVSVPPGMVVLTFDDGPSEYTPRMLEILRAHGVTATFFVIGSQALRSPRLQEMLYDGHEIGGHTFTHRDLLTLPDWQKWWDINAGRLAIEAYSGRSSRLFRAPLLHNSVRELTERGYVVVGVDADSRDWQGVPVSEIIANATRLEDGGVILLHDGGGVREATMQALPAIIEHYQTRGMRFATVSQALGVPADVLMPPLSPFERAVAGSVRAVAGVIVGLRWALFGIVIFSIAAIFGRAALVVVTTFWQSRRELPAERGDIPCTIIVPAYNEENVIRAAVASLLASDHKAFRVIVVDDGSTDRTYQVASQIHDPRLTVIRQANAGKSAALNRGVAAAETEVVVGVDADTVFTRRTLRQLCRHFEDGRVGAVSGNTRVANRDTLLTKMQALEYIIGFNLDRRMTDVFDCITVVPGAVGAFRASALAAVGGFSKDTLAEDTDVAIAIKEAGYRIVFDQEAVAYTEAPATVRDLLKQRFRWSFGILQSLYKHRSSFLNPRRGTLGLVGLPYLVLYQYMFPLVGPFFDLGLVVGLLSGRPGPWLAGALVYLMLDVVITYVALRIDKQPLKYLWLLIPQRLLYRQLMYYVIARSLLQAVRGQATTWHKAERSGKMLPTA